MEMEAPFDGLLIIIIIIKPELNSANKLEAINTLAVSVVNYSFNIINRTLEELAKLDTKTRKFLTMYKMHHPNLTWKGCNCLELKDVEGSYNWSFPTSQPLSVLINTSGDAGHPPPLCQRP